MSQPRTLNLAVDRTPTSGATTRGEGVPPSRSRRQPFFSSCRSRGEREGETPSPRWVLRAFLFAALAVVLTGCRRGDQTVTDPAGVQSNSINSLFWFTFWICVGVYVITMLFTIWGTWRHRNRPAAADLRAGNTDADVPPDIAPDPRVERRLTAGVIASIAITTLILFVLLFSDFITGRHIYALGGEPHPMVVQVKGHQWWWEVAYVDQDPSQIVTDANEIHIPKGQTVRIDLISTDVIHSFWVPNLHGKKDLVPLHKTSIYMRADKIPNGEKEHVFWGQCAEYCGYEHAKMRLAVVVHEPDAFKKWLDAARAPAQEPQNAAQKRGQVLFQTQTCNMCHTIQGINAWGTVGPNLTHIASRRALAAGSLPNTMGHLGGWILDPQSIKPGVRMPQHNLSGDDLQALLEYLESLK